MQLCRRRRVPELPDVAACKGAVEDDWKENDIMLSGQIWCTNATDADSWF